MTTNPQNPNFDPIKLLTEFQTWHNKQTIGQPKNAYTITQLYYWLGETLQNTYLITQIWQELNLITKTPNYPSSGLGDIQYTFNQTPPQDTTQP